MQFRDRDEPVAFRDDRLTNGVSIQLRRLFNPEQQSKGGPFANAQADVLRMAYESGYWDIPRRITLEALGARLEISGSAATQRSRRGIETLVTDTLFNDRDTGMR